MNIHTITLESDWSVCVDIVLLTAGVCVAIVLTVTGVRDIPPSMCIKSRRCMEELVLGGSSSSSVTFKHLKMKQELYE